MTPEETKAYKKGYAAGRKRVGAEQARWEKVHADILNSRLRQNLEREDAFFNAALAGLLSASTPWTIGIDDKRVKVNDMPHYIELANRFARHAMAMRRMP